MSGRARRAVAALAALALTAAGCGPDEVATPHGPRWGRPLLLDETFDGDLDPRVWGTCHWWGPDGCTIATNDELQWYLADQVEVGDGHLRLTAAAEPVPATAADGDAFPYRSGMVSSGRPGDEDTDEPRFAFTYGTVEVRFRIPDATGTWPALWMLPVTNEALPEIDILEVHGQAPARPSVTLHDAEGGRERRVVRTADLSTGWHTATLEWTPDRLVWAVDGVQHMEVTGDQVPREPMYLVANLAVGGDAGPPDPSAFPATFLVDRIRVWGPR